MLCCLNPDCLSPLNPEDSTLCSSCDTPLVPLLRNRYRVIKVLSDEGGFGRTYLAEDIDKLKELCVVKQFAPKIQGTSALKKAVQLFQEEAQRLQQLGEHNQIPHLLAYFEENNYLFLVQQYIDGQNLSKELQQVGTYSESNIRELLLDLLPVLQFIHKQGVIHRDIKPQNIIRRYGDGRLVLIDFGASKQLSVTVQTKIGTTIGSHGYTPIEQMEDGKAYPSSDLFSLGATCFHLLTGISPSKLWLQHGFSWVNDWQRYLKKPSSREVTLSSKLSKVLDKLLKVEFQKRYQAAEEVLRDLSQLSPPLPSTLLAANSSQSQLLPSPQSTLELRYPLFTGAGIVLLGLIGISVYLFYSPGVTQSSSVSQPSNTTVQSSHSPDTLRGHSSDVNSVAFSPDGQSLASASDDRTIKIWNLATRQTTFTLKGHSQWIWAVAFSPDGKTLASGSADSTIKLWNLETGQEMTTLGGHSGGVSSLTFSPDGRTLASGGLDKTVKLWDLTTGKEIRTLKGHTKATASVRFSPDGMTLASGSWDKTIKLWNVLTGEEVSTFKGHTDYVLSVAFSPDGVTLASGSKDKTIKLWNIATGDVTHTLTTHSDKVNSVAFLPTTAYSKSSNVAILVSGSSDNTIKLWNSANGKEIETLKKDSGYIYSVTISPDGQRIASGGSADNVIKVWQLPSLEDLYISGLK
ncbi:MULTISPECIES: serine/threonine-protein kinase [Nostocales]|uniref:Protein kinase n=3 Tax=Nostocales TaxID=1161 RepID=A0A0C1RM71_9CYAN|nr:serine/threonine-protein kinase [Tolypothrix bouteillei]KAF3887991.1 protein kinase [Tolypothrix bouteillei VB521301]